MGATDWLIRTGKSRKWRVGAYLTLGVAVLVFLLGATLAGVGGNEVTVSEISVSSTGKMRFGTVGTAYGYHLTVDERDTDITADIKPHSATMPVVFDVPAASKAYVEFVNGKVAAGGPAILRLKKQASGAYYVSRPEDPANFITVTVTSGKLRPINIYITIKPVEDGVTVVAQLQRQQKVNGVVVPNSWRTTSEMSMSDFTAGPGALKYRVVLRCGMFGQTVWDTAQQAQQYQYFEDLEIADPNRPADITGFRLFSAGNPYVDSQGRNVIVAGGGEEFTFRAFANINGVKFQMREDLRIRIVP